MENIHHLGSIADPRTEEEKGKDFRFHNLYSLAPVNWVEKDPMTWRTAMQRYQFSSSSCVAHSCDEAYEIVAQIIASARPIYSRRSNTPSLGMYPQNACDILRNFGTDTEQNVPSNGLGEADMNVPVNTPTPLKIIGYGAINIDMEQLAQAIDLHKVLILSMQLSWKEWQAVQGVPEVIAGAQIAGGHELSAVDYTLYKGKKAIICKNHWVVNDQADGYSIKIGNQYYVVLTEDYIKARVDSAFFIVPPPPAPVDRPLLKLGSTGEAVITLQAKINAVMGSALLVDGQFGRKTQLGLMAFQSSHGLKGDGVCGKMTWQAFDMIDIITMVCTSYGIEPLVGISVAVCESGLNPKAFLFNAPSKSTDRGLYQWNDKYHAEITDAQAYDPKIATQKFCESVKQNPANLKGNWSASMPCWSPKLTPAMRQKYGIV